MKSSFYTKDEYISFLNNDVNITGNKDLIKKYCIENVSYYTKSLGTLYNKSDEELVPRLTDEVKKILFTNTVPIKFLLDSKIVSCKEKFSNSYSHAEMEFLNSGKSDNVNLKTLAIKYLYLNNILFDVSKYLDQDKIFKDYDTNMYFIVTAYHKKIILSSLCKYNQSIRNILNLYFN